MSVLALDVSVQFENWMLGLPAWGLWALCAVSIGVLVFGADKTVSAAVALAHSLGMSIAVIGANIPDVPSVAERPSWPSRLEAPALASEPSGQQRL